VRHSVPCVRNMVGCTNHTSLVTAISSIPMVLLSKGMGVQEAHEGRNHSIQIEHKGENFDQIISKEVKKAFHKQSHKPRNVVQMTLKVTVIPTTVREAAGRIAQGNNTCV
jgi:hypothetical protein